MSHELFHDVTDRRPRAGKATGGTLAVSIVAHALILAAVVVVPLLATDILPALPSNDHSEYAVPVVPPPPAPPPVVRARTPAASATPTPNVAPVNAPDRIVAEAPPPNSIVCAECVVSPTPPGGVPDSFGDRIGVVLPSPPPPPPQQPVRATALNMPTKIKDVAPDYPHLARIANVDGVVIIEAVIAVDGSVRDARVLRSQHPLLDRSALDAVRQWRYAPTRLNGVAVPVIVTVTVRFQLRR